MHNKLANDIASATMEKLAGWEKRWIESRMARGDTIGPTVTEYRDVLSKLRAVPKEYNSRKWGGQSLDSAPFSTIEHYNSEIPKAAPPSGFENFKRAIGFSPTLSPQEKLIKQLNGRLAHNARAEHRADVMAPNPINRDFTSKASYDRPLKAHMVSESEKKAKTDMRFNIRERENMAERMNAIRDIRARSNQEIRQKLRDMGAISISEMLRGVDRKNSYYKGIKSRGMYKRDGSNIADDDIVFVSGLPYVSAGYAEEGGEFIVGNRSRLMQKYPRLKFTNHQSNTSERDRMHASLNHRANRSGKNEEWSKDPQYEAIAPWGAVSDPEYTSRHSILYKIDDDDSRIEDLLRSTLLSPHGSSAEDIANMTSTKRAINDNYEKLEQEADIIESAKRSSLFKELEILSSMYEPKFKKRKPDIIESSYW